MRQHCAIIIPRDNAMTKLPEKAFQEAAKLSEQDQDALARAVLEDLDGYLELHDPKVQRGIRKSNAEHLAGKSRPFGNFLSELSELRDRKQG